MKWITIPEGPLQTNAAAPSIVIFRNISFLSTTKFHIYNQATHAWNKTILSAQGHSFRSCNAVTPNCSCISSLCSPSTTPVSQLFPFSQTMFMSTWSHLPPPLIWQTCSQIRKSLQTKKNQKMTNTWNWYFFNVFCNCNWSL